MHLQLTTRKVTFVWLAIALLAGVVLATLIASNARAAGTTYVMGDFVVEDGKFELRMGETAYFGYDAEQRIPTIPGLIEIVIGPIQVGDTVSFARCRQSGSRSTKTHHMTVEKLGIDHNLDDGRFGADPPGGAVGDGDDPTNNCEFTFDAPGEFIIDDSTDPGEHGVAKFIVEGEAAAPAKAAAAAGPGAVMTVYPSVVRLPEAGTRERRVGVWLIGAGLEAGQEFSVRIRWNAELVEQDITPFLVGFDDEAGAVANIHGAFTLGMGQGLQDFREPRRDVLFQGNFGAVTIRLYDALTGELLAVAPMTVCGPNREQRWCNAAQDLVPLR